jgi:hypothetical protein
MAERWPGIRSQFVMQVGEWDLRLTWNKRLFLVSSTRMLMLTAALKHNRLTADEKAAVMAYLTFTNDPLKDKTWTT